MLVRAKKVYRGGPEIIVGLVGAVGTDLGAVTDLLRTELSGAAHTSDVVRLSELLTAIPRHAHLQAASGGPEDDRIDSLMQAGDDFRRNARRGDAVALLAIARIRSLRAQATGSERKIADRHAYVLRSLKHPDEIATLREVYGDAFVAVSVYAPLAERRRALSEAIARSRKAFGSAGFGPRADELIEKDEKSVGDDYGQNVRDAFPEADVFLDASEPAGLRPQIARFVEILLGHPFRTPTTDEYAMFHAKAAALRSADLSRQVGAVIATEEGDIIAAGCNEVPKAGGGAVWERIAGDIEGDYRDFRIGHDSSARMKQEIVEELFEKLSRAGWLNEEKGKLDKTRLFEMALLDGPNPILKGTRAASILEFGRIVHAEMAALSVAARRGLSVKGATLYCTTFPCHMCARHIIASGIKRVVYIEPYPKSMAKDLYRRSVRVDRDTEADCDAVDFVSFTGVSPRRYLQFFEMRPRKDKRGLVLAWKPREARPRILASVDYTDREAAAVEFLAIHQERLGLPAVAADRPGQNANPEEAGG